MIYTAITSNKDKPRDDIQCFTGSGGNIEAKRYKVLSHEYIKGDSIWVDGNITPNRSEKELFDIIGEADIGVFKHPDRKTIYEEDKAIVKMGKGLHSKAVDDYNDIKGLWACGVIIRRHNTRTEELNKLWWDLINKYTLRDQVTFPIAVAQIKGLKVFTIDKNIFSNDLFIYKEHNH